MGKQSRLGKLSILFKFFYEQGDEFEGHPFNQFGQRERKPKRSGHDGRRAYTFGNRLAERSMQRRKEG